MTRVKSNSTVPGKHDYAKHTDSGVFSTPKLHFNLSYTVSAHVSCWGSKFTEHTVNAGCKGPTFADSAIIIFLWTCLDVSSVAWLRLPSPPGPRPP